MYARLQPRSRTLLSLIVPLVLLSLAPVAAAQEPVGTQTREHVVRRGDTLWGLSRLYLMNPFLWPRIFEANRAVVEDPHWIYPGERLVIPGLADTVGVIVTTAPPEVPAAAPQTQQRSRFYTPRQTTSYEEQEPTVLTGVREEPYLVEPREWSSAAWLAEPSALPVRGRVERLADPTRTEDRLPSRLHPYERVFVGEVRGGSPDIGDTLMVVALSGEVPGHGSKVVPVALLEIEELTREGGAVAQVVHQFGEAIIGHTVIDMPERPAFRRGSTRPVQDGEAGTLVAMLQEDPLSGTMDIGFVDLGQGVVSPGDVLVAYVPDMIGADGRRLRVAEIARLRVIRTAGPTATVRVIATRNTGLRQGLAVQVTERAP